VTTKNHMPVIQCIVHIPVSNGQLNRSVGFNRETFLSYLRIFISCLLLSPYLLSGKTI
jgi:hypothetical protein